jgi:hypothetical protein
MSTMEKRTMRRMIPTLTAALLALSAGPALTADAAEPTAEASAVASVEPTDLERVEAPEAGIAMSFPADWNVRVPMASRESEIRTGPDAEPVYVTTVFMANAGDGRWCDVDVYGAIPVPLDQHVYSYAGYLQSVYEVDRTITVTETELPVGDALRIDMADAVRDRVWAMYMFDRVGADGADPDRFLLTCVADPGTEPYWEAIAESVELLPAVVEEPAA